MTPAKGKEKTLVSGLLLYMAEEQRFELWRHFRNLSVFKTDPFNRLGIPPYGGPCRARTYDPPVMGRLL